MYLVIGMIIILLLLIINARIDVSFEIIYEEREKTGIVYISFYRICLYQKTIDLSDHNHVKKWNRMFNELSDLQSFTQLRKEFQLFLKKVTETTGLVKGLLNKTKCNKLTWNTYIGTGEASTAGVAASALWIIKGMFLGVVSNQCLLLCQPLIAVNPDFQQRYMYTHFNCIVSLKVGQTIYIVLKEIKEIRAL